MKCRNRMKKWSMLIAWTLFGTLFVQPAIADNWYVSLDGTGQGTGGWTDATNDLQGAIDACAEGGTVWVSNGVYQTGGRPVPGFALTNRVVLPQSITVRALSNDPADTVIRGKKGSGALDNGPDAIRCVYKASTGWLIGFTVTNGATLSMPPGDNPAVEIDQRGGGIYSSWTKVPVGGVSNCVIIGNSSAGQGGGVYSVTLYDCVIAGNTGRTDASQVTRGAGGGASACALISDCILTGNTGSYGSAANASTLKNCLIISNYSGYATYSGTLENCLIINNQSTYAIRGGTFYNCTIANNDGYGLYRDAYLTNSIVYFNRSGNFHPSYTCSMAYSCTTPPQDD